MPSGPLRQLANAGAQSTVSGAITSSQTSVTVASGSGFPAIIAGGQFSVVILDSGNPAWNKDSPLSTPFEYQQVNGVAGNVLTFGPGGGSAARSSFASTTPKAFQPGATVAAVSLAEDYAASVPWKLFEQYVSAGTVASFNPVSLPTTYRDLDIWWGAITDQGGGQALNMQANGDTGTNYSWSTVLALIGGTQVQSAGTNSTSGRIGTAGTVYAAGRLSIHNYAIAQVATYRQWTGHVWQDSDATGAVGNVGGEWKNTASAITSLLVFPGVGLLKAGSWLRIFGVP